MPLLSTYALLSYLKMEAEGSSEMAVIQQTVGGTFQKAAVVEHFFFSFFFLP